MKRHITELFSVFLLWGMSVEAGTCNSNSCDSGCQTNDPYCYACNQVCPDECHFFLGAEGLWWTACENDLDFAADFDAATADILGVGKIHFADYDWNWGVRGWMGWNWCCGWDATVSYTWFKTDGDKFVDTTEEDISLIASTLHPDTGLTTADTATITLDLKYQAANALFGRTVNFCGDTLVLHPFIGFHGIILEQEQVYLYEGGDFGTGSTATPARVTWDSKLKGAGLIGGADFNFSSSCGLGILGSIGGSVLASKADVEHLQEILDITGNVNETDIALDEDQCICVPGLHVKAGFGWDFDCGGCLLMELHVLYEFNSYFNTPHLRRYSFNNVAVSSSGTSGNVTLQGITVGASIFF